MIDPALLHAWLAGRSVARGLPAPVADRGGWRVDTGAADEVRRWVFAAPGEGLRALGRAIAVPCHPIKLCASGDTLLACLPDRWRLAPMRAVMVRTAAAPIRPLPAGFAMHVDRDGATVVATIFDGGGVLAARGGIAVAADAVVYDRIEVATAYRRRGLGGAVMARLETAAGDDRPHVLVATDMGEALYRTIGWRTVAPYATAIVAP